LSTGPTAAQLPTPTPTPTPWVFHRQQRCEFNEPQSETRHISGDFAVVGIETPRSRVRGPPPGRVDDDAGARGERAAPGEDAIKLFSVVNEHPDKAPRHSAK